MLRGPKLWVNLILNVIGARLRSTGTHFDHNRYIIRIFIFQVFYRSLWSHAKVLDPLYRGFRKYFFVNYYFNLLLVTPSMFYKWGKKLNQNFPIYHSSLPQAPCTGYTTMTVFWVSRLLQAFLEVSFQKEAYYGFTVYRMCYSNLGHKKKKKKKEQKKRKKAKLGPSVERYFPLFFLISGSKIWP